MKLAQRQNINYLFRFVIGIVLIAIIVKQIDLGQLTNLVKNIKGDYCIVAVAMMIMDRIGMVVRWLILLKAKSIDVPVSRVIKIYFLSSFIGTFIPSSIGADTIRAYSLSKYTFNATESISSIVVDRILSLFALLSFALTGALLFNGQFVGQNVLMTIVLMAAGFTVMVVLMMNRTIMVKSENFLSKRKNKVLRALSKLCDSVLNYQNQRKSLLSVLVLALFIQGIRILFTYYMALALNLTFAIKYFVVLVPLIDVVTLLPISVGGIGVQEGAFVYFFSRIGMSSAEAFTISVLLHIIVIVFTLPGGVVYLLEGLSVEPKKSQFVQTERSAQIEHS